MDDAQKKYYWDMLGRERGVLITHEEKLVGIVTFFVGDDDAKFLLYHKPWEVIEDNPDGTVLYIDQFIAYKGRSMMSQIHREFTNGLKELKIKFPNIKTVKWIRVGAQFRKHGKIEGVTNGRRIHSKSITF